MKRAAFLLLLAATLACDAFDPLVGDDAGVVDGGASDDAGSLPQRDAGFDAGDPDEQPDAGPRCVIEPLSVPFTCEDDADWCSPPDQTHAFYDLAAGWSRREGDEWIIELRTWGRMPFSDGLLAPPWLIVSWNDTVQPQRTIPHVPSSYCLNQPETWQYGDGMVELIFFTYEGPSCFISLDPFDFNDEDEVESTGLGGCAYWEISSDFTTVRARLNRGPVVDSFWHATLAYEGFGFPDDNSNYGCSDDSGGFVPSRGGAADGLTFLPLSSVLTACSP